MDVGHDRHRGRVEPRVAQAPLRDRVDGRRRDRRAVAAEVGEADIVEQAIAAALANGLRTGDIAGPGTRTVGTAEMGDAIIAEVDKLSA